MWDSISNVHGWAYKGLHVSARNRNLTMVQLNSFFPHNKKSGGEHTRIGQGLYEVMKEPNIV